MPYYEGWYMKQQQGGEVLAVIAGRADEEAFIQVLNKTQSWYIPYPLKSWHKAHDIIRIGGSVFTPFGMKLAIHSPTLTLTGGVRYTHPAPLHYNIMGPFSPLPLETRHEVHSMRHDVRGTLTLNGKPHRYTWPGGLGYMEGDRGTSFPTGYTWLQSILGPETSVMAAIATIPFSALHFTGCIAVVWHQGREYRFATYLGVHIIHNDAHCIELRQRELRLVVRLGKAGGHKLHAPVKGKMQRPIHENPSLPAHFRFWRRGDLLIDQTGPATSYERVLPEK